MYRTRIQRPVLLGSKTVNVSTMRNSSGVVLSSTKYPLLDIVGSHQCSDSTHPGPPYRSGGGLVVSHDYPPYASLGTAQLYWPAFKYTYDIDFRPNMLADSCPVNLAILGDPEQYGATCWKRFKPGRTGANLGQFIGELRDLPRLFKFQAKSFRDVGGNYLNYQFGWKPFLSDLQSFLDLTKKIDKRLDFLRRNNNKFIRRSGVLFTEDNTEVTDCGFPVTPVFDVGFYPGGIFTHTSKCATTIYRKVWFEGKMKFFIPNFDSPVAQIEEVIRQFGLMPSPSLVYELTPWSWLIDYFSNLGDVIDNMSSSQAAPNLVALYAYVMNNIKATKTYSTSFSYLKTRKDEGSVQKVSLTFSHSWEQKARAEASPFGFSLSLDELSSYQLSILSALGLSHFPKIR